MNKQADKTIIELYKAHYTASEAAVYLEVSYQTIIARYRAYKALGIIKYDRMNLIPKEALNVAAINEA